MNKWNFRVYETVLSPFHSNHQVLSCPQRMLTRSNWPNQDNISPCKSVWNAEIQTSSWFIDAGINCSMRLSTLWLTCFIPANSEIQLMPTIMLTFQAFQWYAVILYVCLYCLHQSNLYPSLYENGIISCARSAKPWPLCTKKRHVLWV